jgi:hypothetical protein
LKFSGKRDKLEVTVEPPELVAKNGKKLEAASRAAEGANERWMR